MDKGNFLGDAAGLTDGPARRQTGSLRAPAVLRKPATKSREQEKKKNSKEMLPETGSKKMEKGKEFALKWIQRTQQRLILHTGLLKEWGVESRGVRIAASAILLMGQEC